MLEKFKNKQISTHEMKTLLGGVSRAEYCATNHMIMQSCFAAGDLGCMSNAGMAWETHCAPYGM